MSNEFKHIIAPAACSYSSITVPLRFVKRPEYVFGDMKINLVLQQQRLIQGIDENGKSFARSEWIDVPIVDEE